MAGPLIRLPVCLFVFVFLCAYMSANILLSAYLSANILLSAYLSANILLFVYMSSTTIMPIYPALVPASLCTRQHALHLHTTSTHYINSLTTP